MTLPSSGWLRGRRALQLHYPPHRTPSLVPMSAGLRARGPPCLGTPSIGCVHSAASHLRYPPAHADLVMRAATSIDRPNEQRALSLCPPPSISRDFRDTQTPVLAGTGMRSLSTITLRHPRGQQECKQEPRRVTPFGGNRHDPGYRETGLFGEGQEMEE